MNTAMILAGGKGTRFSEMTHSVPKPMIKANEKPLLIHIINLYINYGTKDIVILAGYKKDIISEYFNTILNESKLESDLYTSNDISIKVLDTGLETMTGGRIKIGIEYKNNEESFFLTYGDALSDVNLSKLKEFHKLKKPLVTVTAVRPPARFGSLEIENGLVKKFGEKDQAKEGWINGGFFALEPSVKDFIDNSNTIFEKFPLEEISKRESLVAYQHPGFWQCADTIRELELLEKAIKDNNYAENYKAL